uniref:Uncharacterized protein n=1 Tax=Arundo donax TaxID=35708 RepID=A0A0A9GFW6_ARUDO
MNLRNCRCLCHLLQRTSTFQKQSKTCKRRTTKKTFLGLIERTRLDHE